MTVRLWAKLARNALGVSALTGAAQLGVAYGLGLLDWAQPFDASDDNAWSALLTWVSFIFAGSVLAGAAAGRRGLRRLGRSPRRDVRAPLSVIAFAAIGATLIIPLAWLPSRAAHPSVNVDPQLVVVLTAGAGILAGAVLAAIALRAAPVAGGLMVTTSWVWLFAIGSAALQQDARQQSGALARNSIGVLGQTGIEARVGVLHLPALGYNGTWWSGSSLMVIACVLTAFAVSIVARWGGAGKIGVAVSGLAGPALLASAYVIAGPGRLGEHEAQSAAYRGSLIAAAAGLCASVAVTLLRRPQRVTAVTIEPTGKAVGGLGAALAGEPTAWTPGRAAELASRAARIDSDTGVGRIPRIPRPGEPIDEKLSAELSEYVDWVHELGADREPV